MHRECRVQLFKLWFTENFPKSERENKSMFQLNPSELKSRYHEKYYVQPATTFRLRDSAIADMQRLLIEMC